MNAPDVMVGAVAVAVVLWVLLYACSPPPLPAEGPFTETVASNRDR